MRDKRRLIVRRLLVGSACGLLCLALPACGGNGDRDASGRETVRVGVAPVADAAPLYLGRDRGFFADENLEIELRQVQTAQAIAASVVSGEAHFGFGETTSLITARSRGLPLRIVSYGTLGGSNDARAPIHLLVGRDSTIKTPADLEGKTVGLASLRVVGHLTVNAALDERGVDYSKVNFIEIPLPGSVGALESGRVDAIAVPQPFATLALAAGHRSLLRPVVETAPDFIVGAYFTTDQYIGRERAVVDRFIRAVTRSLDYAAAHPAEVRKVVLSYTQIPPQVIGRITLPDFSPPKDYSTLELHIDLAAKYGFIQKKPTLSELLYRP